MNAYQKFRKNYEETLKGHFLKLYEIRFDEFCKEEYERFGKQLEVF